MVWTYLEVGTVTRATALSKEAEIRGLHAAEAGIRLYITTGQQSEFELNGCQVHVSLKETRLVATATPKRRGPVYVITLDTEKGIVTSRGTNEEN